MIDAVEFDYLVGVDVSQPAMADGAGADGEKCSDMPKEDALKRTELASPTAV